MRLAVFQHINVEHPGIFREFLAADGIEWTAFELDEGEPIPDLSTFDALWVMGGPMDVWEVDEHPWLTDEVSAIKRAVVERRMPFFGFCLGHQLLALALGAQVGPAARPEVGMMKVAATDEGKGSALFRGLPDPQLCLQWHGAEVKSVPDGAKCLATSEDCAIQALDYQGYAFGVQYHVEITEKTVAEWGAVPAYATALEQVLGKAGLREFEAACESALPACNALARQLYDNFMKIAVERTRRQ